MSAQPETRSYRGSSMEEILPRIREELGPDAVITRRREGVAGGIGGFFAKRCVEIEARPPAVILPPPAVPRRSVIDVYDTPFEPVALDTSFADLAFAEPIDDITVVTPVDDITVVTPVNDIAAATPVDDDAHGAPPADETEPQFSENALLEILLAQTSPFADELAVAVERVEAAEPIEVVERIETVERVVEAAEEHDDSHRDDAGYDDAVISLLLAGGLSSAMAQVIVAEAQRELAPFEPETPLRTLARRTLAQRLTVKHGARAKHRTIALVGPPGAGKTLAAAKLCNAFATSGRDVAAISLEPARRAMRLVMFTDMVDVNLEIADATKLIQHARERTADAAIVIADTPAIDPRKRTSFTKLARLLTALEPDETHLVLPADWSLDDGRALLDAARDTLPINRLLITHADRPAPVGLAVGLSLATKLPVSYVSESALATGGIRPADPKQLARMVL
ncbi:MAG: AAA family ATPase [Gaiellaceae bacterium]